MIFKQRFLWLIAITIPLLGLTPAPTKDVFLEGEFSALHGDQETLHNFRAIRQGAIGQVEILQAGKTIQRLYIDTTADYCLLDTKVFRPCRAGRDAELKAPLFIWRMLDFSAVVKPQTVALPSDNTQSLKMPDGVTKHVAAIYEQHLQALKTVMGEAEPIGTTQMLGEVVKGTRREGLLVNTDAWVTEDGIALDITMLANEHETIPKEYHGTRKRWQVKRFHRYVPKQNQLTKVKPPNVVKVKVIGEQWQWRYQYSDSCIEQVTVIADSPSRQLGSNITQTQMVAAGEAKDASLVVPVGQRIELSVTSKDVIHTWWVPDFAVKTDAVPGYNNHVWFEVKKPGMYRGVCAELCGRDHSFHIIQVLVLPQAEYDQWFRKKEAACRSKLS